MKTTPNPIRARLQVDPRIVKKTRRDNAAYGSLGELPGEQDQDYMHQSPRSSKVPQFLDFGRSGL